MTAKEYLNKHHPTAIRSMDEITKLVPRIDDFSAVIIEMLEDYAKMYHQAKSNEEAEERYEQTLNAMNDINNGVPPEFWDDYLPFIKIAAFGKSDKE